MFEKKVFGKNKAYSNTFIQQAGQLDILATLRIYTPWLSARPRFLNKDRNLTLPVGEIAKNNQLKSLLTKSDYGRKTMGKFLVQIFGPKWSWEVAVKSDLRYV